VKFPPAVPEIPVSDLPAALAWYRDRLNFAVDWADEELGLAGLSQGECRVFMGNAAHLDPIGVRPPVLLWFNAASREEVDEIHARWRAAGAEITLPPAARPWKLYEFLARDPDGNVLRVFYDFGWEEQADVTT